MGVRRKHCSTAALAIDARGLWTVKEHTSALLLVKPIVSTHIACGDNDAKGREVGLRVALCLSLAAN